MSIQVADCSVDIIQCLLRTQTGQARGAQSTIHYESINTLENNQNVKCKIPVVVGGWGCNSSFPTEIQAALLLTLQGLLSLLSKCLVLYFFHFLWGKGRTQYDHLP